ncbi:hypothetical protein CK203_029596 [Vitis vinifera]|uniref:Uncharacterized protein n=1 Tax=Vitis vinifera TaxID=29760 RepID=A0A438JCE8_VITVI|nr:hypothetical protein CK203_029596 [Vitis vinifera]
MWLEGNDDAAGGPVRAVQGRFTVLCVDKATRDDGGEHGSKSWYRSLIRRVPRRIGLGVSI